jgi:quercetin dioxygenase-like cupin family protein
MEIRRFGPGHRRPDGPPGTQGITGQVIWDDDRANISELAFSRRAAMAPHTNPNTTLFVVVSGGGWVQVGDERVPIRHGEAVVWPAGVDHGAYTDGSEMRAIVVELSDRAPARGDLVLEGLARSVSDGSIDPGPAASVVTPAEGSLADRPQRREDHDEREGEPW